MPGFDTLFIISGQQGFLQSLLPEQGISLLALVQFSAIWFGALMAFAALIGIALRVQSEEGNLVGRSWYFIFGVCLLYPLLNSWVVL